MKVEGFDQSAIGLDNKQDDLAKFTKFILFTIVLKTKNISSFGHHFEKTVDSSNEMTYLMDLYFEKYLQLMNVMSPTHPPPPSSAYHPPLVHQMATPIWDVLVIIKVRILSPQALTLDIHFKFFSLML